MSGFWSYLLVWSTGPLFMKDIFYNSKCQINGEWNYSCLGFAEEADFYMLSLLSPLISPKSLIHLRESPELHEYSFLNHCTSRHYYLLTLQL